MNRAQLTVLAFGLVLASLAVLFPLWNGLSYWEQVTYPSGGSSGSAVDVRGSRFFIFTGPEKPRPSQTNAEISRYSPKLQVAQLITEASFITALTAFWVWMLRTSPRAIESGRQKSMLLVHAALVLYMVSLTLPAIIIDVKPVSGWRAAGLSFIGAGSILNSGFQIQGGQVPACLIGASGNLLFVLAYIALLARCHLSSTWPTYKACSFMACLAAACTVGVLIPLTYDRENFSYTIGYALWVGAATLIAFAARRLSTAKGVGSDASQDANLSDEGVRKRLMPLLSWKRLLLAGLLVACFAGTLYGAWMGFRSWQMAKAANELREIGATVNGYRWATVISFRGTTLNDESLAGVADELGAFRPVSLDLSDTEVTGRSFEAFSELEVFTLVLDPHQLHSESILQLNEGRGVYEIELADISEDELLDLIPVIRGISESRPFRLTVDLPHGAWFAQLEKEAPRLRGVQNASGWSPIGDAVKGPRGIY